MANALICDPSRFTFGEHHVPSLETSAPLLLGERVVWISDDNLGPEHGTVRWIGKLPEMGQDWVAGIELDNPAGKHDGRWNNRQLFLTKPKHGLIIPVMGLIKEDEFIGSPQRADPSPEQTIRGLPPDPPGWYDNIEYHNAHRRKSESQFWKRLRSKRSGKSDHKKRQPQPESAALQVAASIAAGDVPSAVTPRTRAKTQTVRSDLGVELDKWYEATDFSTARQCKKKSNTLIGTSPVTSYGDTEASSLASYDTAEEGSGKAKGGFMSFFRWLRPKKASKKKPESQYLPSPSLSEGTRVKSGSVHSVTSTSSSFQYVAMDFSQSRSVSNAPTLEAKSKKSPKEAKTKPLTSEEKQRNAGMKFVMNELRVKLTPAANNTALANEEKPEKTNAADLIPHQVPDSNELEGKATDPAAADDILVDADYANVSPLPKARAACVRRKKRRAPPPPPILPKTGGGSKNIEVSGAGVSASPGPKRGAHVKGKRRAPSPPLQSTPKPWARTKDGKKNMSTVGVGIEVKENTTDTSQPAGTEKQPVPSISNPPKTADAETNTTLFRGMEKTATVAVSTNTTLIRSQAETCVIPETLPEESNCTNQASSNGILFPLTEDEISTDIPFCDEENEDVLAVTDEINKLKINGIVNPCTSCGQYWKSANSKNQLCSAQNFCPNCSPGRAHVDQTSPVQSVPIVQSVNTAVAADEDNAPQDDELKLGNPVVTDEWKETPRSTQNLISMFNAMSYCFEADKWRVPDNSEPPQGESKSTTSDDTIPLSSPGCTGATTIIEELDDEKWLENVDAEFARLSDAYLQTAGQNSRGGSVHEMTFSEICSNSSHRITPEPSISGDTDSLDCTATNCLNASERELSYDSISEADLPKAWNSPETFEAFSTSNQSSVDKHEKVVSKNSVSGGEHSNAKSGNTCETFVSGNAKVGMQPHLSSASKIEREQPKTKKMPESYESHVVSNNLKANMNERMPSKESITEKVSAKTWSSTESSELHVSNNFKADEHEREASKDSVPEKEPVKTCSSAESFESHSVSNNFKTKVHERVASKESITEGMPAKTWSSAESFEDARDTMTPVIQEYTPFERKSSRSGSLSEDSSFNVKDGDHNSYSIGNPVYSNIPLAAHSKPVPKPRHLDIAKPSVISSSELSEQVLYQNIFPEKADIRGKGGTTWKDGSNTTANVLYVNYPLAAEDHLPETSDLKQRKAVSTGMSKLECNPMYANVSDWRAQSVNKKEMHPSECEMFQEEKRMQSRMKMNRRIFKEAKSRHRSSSQESESSNLEANHTAETSSYARRNPSVSASSSSSPILSSASSVSSALNSPPALPKKIGPIRERRRRSHPVPATINEDGPPKVVKNRSHVRENSGLTTLPTRMPSSGFKPSNFAEEDESKGILVGSLRLQIASKDGPQPSGLSLVTGCSLPRDSGNNFRAPIPLPDKKNRKKNFTPTVNSVIDNPQGQDSLTSRESRAVVMRRRREHGMPARLSEQRRTVGSNLAGYCSNEMPHSSQDPDEHEYYNIRVHTGEGCKLQVRRAHTLDSKTPSGHHHHHHHRHQNPRGREKKGRLQKSFASVAADSPLGKVMSESKVLESEKETSPFERVATPDTHCQAPMNPPLSSHPPSNPVCYPSKYQGSFSDRDLVSLPQNNSTVPNPQNARSSKASQGPTSEISDDFGTLEVNKLLRKLEVSIAEGHIDEAAVLARQLAMLKVKCSVVRNKPRVQDKSSEEICLNLFVEDRTSHIGPINLYVNPSMTVGDLKKKIESNFDFPSNLQRWILGRKLASDDSVPLSDFDIRTSGCPVFLYLMTTDLDIANAYKQRLESYLKALEDLDLDEDFTDDEDTSRFIMEQEADASGDHTGFRYIPSEQRNGHHIQPSEGRGPRAHRLRKSRSSDDASSDTSYGGARPKQPQNGSTTRKQENNVKKEEGWNCPACTMFNDPTRPGCVVCATSRPENYVVPKEYIPKPEEQERLLKERQVELELQQAQERERLENYQKLLEIDDMDVVLNEEAFECPVCFTDIDVGEGIRVRDCLHVFCRVCLAHAVEYSETAEVKCPYRDDNYSCPSVLQHREIQALVTQEVYDRHLQKSVTTAESQADNSFHCKTANCPAWCYFEDNINEFPCPICGHVNCLTCQAIHEDVNCKQYQDKVEFEAATNDEARKTKEALDEMLTKGQAMRCPKCQVILMKKWGCDWICCSMCKTEICWITKGPRWGPAGQGDTSGGCRCGLNGVRCHPQCQYCH